MYVCMYVSMHVCVTVCNLKTASFLLIIATGNILLCLIRSLLGYSDNAKLLVNIIQEKYHNLVSFHFLLVQGYDYGRCAMHWEARRGNAIGN